MGNTEDKEYSRALDEVASNLAWLSAIVLVEEEKATLQGEEYVMSAEQTASANAFNIQIDILASVFGCSREQIQNDLAERMMTIDPTAYVDAIRRREKGMLH